VLAAILNTLPVELSFIDHEDRVRCFSHKHGEKFFPRSRGAIGMAVRNVHPPKSLNLVYEILTDFKAGARDAAEFWIDTGERKVHIRCWPVRGPDGCYPGTAGRHRHPQPDGCALAAPRIGVAVASPQ
jgi:DUF438 domain-containing protein